MKHNIKTWCDHVDRQCGFRLEFSEKLEQETDVKRERGVDVKKENGKKEKENATRTGNSNYWRNIFGWYCDNLDSRWNTDKDKILNKTKHAGKRLMETDSPYKNGMHNSKSIRIYLPLFIVTFSEFINYCTNYGLFKLLKKVYLNKYGNDKIDDKIKEIKVDFARRVKCVYICLLKFKDLRSLSGHC